MSKQGVGKGSKDAKVDNTEAKDVDELKAKISQLESENKQLHAKLHDAPKNRRLLTGLRTFSVTFFIVLSVVTFMLFNISSWVKTTLLDTEAFVNTTSPLIEQPAVQQALQDEITRVLFENINVEQELQRALPENVAFLAGPLSSQVESFANEKIGEILNSDQIANIWGATLETVHSALIDYLQDETKDGVVSINELYQYAGSQLQDSQIAFLLNKQLPDKVGQITVAQIDWVPQARSYVNWIEGLPVVLIMVSIASALTAILLALNKKRAIIVILSMTFLMMLSTLVAINIGSSVVGDQVQAKYSAAATEVYDVITSPLMLRTEGYLALLGAILLVLFASSNIVYVKQTRFYADLYATKTINRLAPRFTRPSWVEWFLDNKLAILWTTFVMLFVAIGFRIPPVYSQVVTAFVTSTVVTGILYLVAKFLLASGKEPK